MEEEMFKSSAFILGFAAVLTANNAAGAANLSSIGMYLNADQLAGTQVISVAGKWSASKGKKRVAKTMRGNLAVSPSAATSDGYPTPGRAFEACGGAGNVFVMYDILPDGTETNHSYHCT